MPRLFKRVLQVDVGAGGRGLSFGGRTFVKVEITKYLSATPDKGAIQMYNLDETRESFFKEPGARLRLTGGFIEQNGIIYDGLIQKVERDRLGNDRIATLTLSADVFETQNTLINRSYSGEVPVRQIVADLMGDAQANYIGLETIPVLASLENFAYIGRLQGALTKILAPLRIAFFEDLGRYRFSMRGQGATHEAFVLGVPSGLSGTPSITEKGVKFTSRLNGLITIGGVVKIESEVIAESVRAGEYTGFFKTIQLTHRGDNRDGEFVTEGLGVPV